MGENLQSNNVAQTGEQGITHSVAMQALFPWHDLQDDTVIWLWFESVNSRWCVYSADVIKTLEEAYQDGETSKRYGQLVLLLSCLFLCLYRIIQARHKYMVHFNTMMQVSFAQESTLCKKKGKRKNNRSEQDSNLRGHSPLDFESNALTTRPSLQSALVA